MNCSTSREKLQLLLDERLSEAEAAEVRGHLAGCQGCREQFEELDVLQRALGALPPVEPPADLLPRMKAAIRREAAETSLGGTAESPSPTWFRPGRWRAVAAVLMLGLGVALLIQERPTPRESASRDWAAGDDIDHPAPPLERRRLDTEGPVAKRKSAVAVVEEQSEDRDDIDGAPAPKEKNKGETKDAKVRSLLVAGENAADKKGDAKGSGKNPRPSAGVPVARPAPSPEGSKARRREKVAPGNDVRGGLNRPQGGVLGLANDSFASDEARGLYDLAVSSLEEAERRNAKKSLGKALEVQGDVSKAIDPVSKAPRDVVVVLRGDQAVARLKSWASREKLRLRDLPVASIAGKAGQGDASRRARSSGHPPQPVGGGGFKATKTGGPATKGRVFLLTVPESRLAALETSLESLGRQGVSLQRLSPPKRRSRATAEVSEAPAPTRRKTAPPSAPSAPKKASRRQDSKPTTVRILVVIPDAGR